MPLAPLEKLIVTNGLSRQNGRVIGIKRECDGTETYFIEPLRVDFSSFKNGSRIMRINSKEIEANRIVIEKHTV